MKVPSPIAQAMLAWEEFLRPFTQAKLLWKQFFREEDDDGYTCPHGATSEGAGPDTVPPYYGGEAIPHTRH